MPSTDNRPSPIAGQWYPGDARTLKHSIDTMLAKADPQPVHGRIVGVIVPHAGYLYSGRVAAQAFRCIQGSHFERIVVISPMHHPYFAPVLSSGHQGYVTPLGTLPIDHELLADLNKQVAIEKIRNDPEHSLEIELPFLQRAVAGAFQLVPLMLRDQSYHTARTLGEALGGLLAGDSSTLMVASSDMSHFYPEEEASKLDRRMLTLWETYDSQGIIEADAAGIAFACGKAAIATVLIACQKMGATHCKVTGYGTSGDASGDHNRVVGYGSAVIYGAE
jgi:hypothetical protein